MSAIPKEANKVFPLPAMEEIRIKDGQNRTVACVNTYFDVTEPKPSKRNPFTQEGVLVGLLFGAILGVAGLIGLVWCRIQYKRWQYEAIQA